MLLGIGVDICEVQRFDRLSEDEFFLKRIFTEDEINFCNRIKRKSECFAARFAAKEAFLKAIGIGIGEGVSFLEIEVKKDKSGKPYFGIYGGTYETLKKLGGAEIHLSLSHEKSAAIAFVVISKD